MAEKSKWTRRLGIGCLAILGLLIVAGVGIWIWKPWVPPIVVAEPGDGGQRISEGGLIANYYPVAGDQPAPGILILGGSEGGISHGVDRQARSLQEQGFTVLVQSYFRAPGQSPNLEAVPLEIFDQALAWLARQPEVDGERLGIVGTSKGAEAALLIASRNPQIDAIVAGMPSNVVWQGVDWEAFGSGSGSSWSVDGQPLPYLPYAAFEWSSEFEIADTYIRALGNLSANRDAIIPVERSTASILLVCGEADTLWPSCPMARGVERRLRENGRRDVRLLAYGDAGHAGIGPPIESELTASDLSMVGGTVDGTIAARQDGWPRVIAHLHAAFEIAEIEEPGGMEER